MPLERVAAAVENVDFHVLSEPLVFRSGKQSRNRIMKSPLSEKMYNWDSPETSKLGLPTQKILNLYEKWGNGGFGLIVTGNLGADPGYAGEAGQGIVSKENINTESRKLFTQMSKAIKSDGALAIAQVNHVGKLALLEYTNSKLEKHTISEEIRDPITFSKEELQSNVFDRFSFAAMTLHECGFDGIEIHAAHEMLFNQFLLPNNPRDDEYGGESIENRTRLLIDTYHNIRVHVPSETGFLIGVKLNSRDFQESGISQSDISTLCQLIEHAGFDFVELTGGAMESVVVELEKRDSTIARENYFFQFVDDCSKVFQQTRVFITGRWQTAHGMITSIKMGLTNGVGLGRWCCAEPDFPKKLQAGEIFSCPDSKFAPSEFGIAKHAAHYQMRQMSESNYDNNHGPAHGVIDFSQPKEAENFKIKAIDYMKYCKSLGNPDTHADCINYVPIVSLNK